jgi:prepilin-type N-terminal cleavage/methylation domain-containing protein
MGTSERRRRAFTLLEVMAAVLVLGLLYTVLAEVAMEGLRAEGISRRRAEASLLVDDRLAQLETYLETNPPVPGTTEEDVSPYHVTTEISPLDVTQWIPPLDPAVPNAAPAANDADSLLMDPDGQSRIDQVRITVAWDEAGTPYQVSRTTFALDIAAIAALLPSSEDLAGTGGSDSEQTGGQTGGMPTGLQDAIKQFGGNIPEELQQAIRDAGGS